MSTNSNKGMILGFTNEGIVSRQADMIAFKNNLKQQYLLTDAYDTITDENKTLVMKFSKAEIGLDGVLGAIVRIVYFA